MSRKIMILGGGSSQINLIRKCREAGYYTILADINPEAPGRKYCDAFEKASTFDADACLSAAEKNRINAVATAGSDQPVFTASVVAEKLGLPSFLNPSQAFSVTNKKAMKEVLSENSIKTPEYMIIDKKTPEKEIRKMRSPYVLKPADSQGQRGVLRLETAADVVKNLDYTLSFSREDYAIAEEYYDSDEITVSGWVTGGEVYIFSVTDRVTIDNLPSIGVCLSHQYPSPYMFSHSAEIAEITKKITGAFGIKNGPLYFQYLAGKDGIYVNEVACRLGGAYEDEFIPFICEVDPASLLIKGAFGEFPGKSAFGNMKPLIPDFNGVYFSVLLLFSKPGKIMKLAFPDLPELSEKYSAGPGAAVNGEPGRNLFITTGSVKGSDKKWSSLIRAKFIIEEGTAVKSIANSTQRAGYAIICGSDPDELNNFTLRFINHTVIQDEKGFNILYNDLNLMTYKSRRRFNEK